MEDNYLKKFEVLSSEQIISWNIILNEKSKILKKIRVKYYWLWIHTWKLLLNKSLNNTLCT